VRWMKPALLAVTLAATCATAAGRTLDLAQAYAAALAQDPQLRASREAAAAGREAVPQARARLLPQIGASASRSRNRLDETSPGLLGLPVSRQQDYVASSAALTLRQPLYRPLEAANLRQAQARTQQVEAQYENDLQQLGVRLSQAYFEVLLAQDQITLVQAQQAAYTLQVDAAKKSLAGGNGTRTDIDEAQARLDASVADALEARQFLDLALRRLRTMVSEPFDALAPLDAAALRLQAPAPRDIDDWLTQAEANSPEIRAAVARLEAARQEIDKARSGHRPSVDVVADWSRNQSDSINRIGSRYSSRSVGVQLSLPLYAGGGVDSAVRQALAEQQQLEETLEALRRDLAVRVHREFAGVSQGVLRIRALEQALRSAELAVESNRKSFEAGARTSVDVLNAEQQRANAQRDLAQARYQYLLSGVRLAALAGRFDGGQINELNVFFSSHPGAATAPAKP
jgi:outer membrane protein, protease secretion system